LPLLDAYNIRLIFIESVSDDSLLLFSSTISTDDEEDDDAEDDDPEDATPGTSSSSCVAFDFNACCFCVGAEGAAAEDDLVEEE
jgi:hypothetical protein